jgi:hypothetical protein
MSYFSYTLVADGPSDKALIPIINWVLRGCTDRPFESFFVSASEARTHDLALKVSRAIALFPSDILFVHRDAERPIHYYSRIQEIEAATALAATVVVPIVPIRMTEAWLLSDELAVRRAANNPNGRGALRLPRVGTLEEMVDPKAKLFELLRTASQLGARRLRSFNQGQARARVAELITDFSHLRVLGSFSQFETDTRAAIEVL